MNKDRLAAKTFGAMVVTGISKVLGFLRTSIFAFLYGATTQTDAFFMSASILTFANGILSCLTALVVPLRTSQIQENGREKADETCSILLNLSLIISVFIGIVLFLFAPSFVRLFAPSFTGEAYDLTVRICRIFFPLTVVLSYVSFAISLLNAHKKFVWSSLIGIALNMGWITIPLLFARTYGIYAMVYGYLIGHLFQIIALSPGLKSIYKYKFSLNMRNKEVINALVMCLPIFIGTLSGTVNHAIDKALASTLPVGSVTSLGYASQLVSLVSAIISTPISTTFFTESSQAANKKDIVGLKNKLSQFSTILALILLPITLLFVFMANEIVMIVFMRGEFSIEAAALTQNAFVFNALILLPGAIGTLMSRCFYSFNDTKHPLYIGLVCIALNIILNFTLIGPMGIGGLTLATSISATFSAISLSIVLKKHTGKLRILTWIKGNRTIAFAGVGLVLAVVLLKSLQIENYYIRFILCATAGMTIYISILLLLKQKETCKLLSIAYNKMRKILGKRTQSW